METKKLKDVKRGEFITRKPYESPKDKQVFIRGEYDRESKKYICTRFSDTCDYISLRGDTVVYIGFTF